MRKYYYSMLLTVFCSLLSLTAWGQTAYAGLTGTTSDWKEGNGYAFCMVSFDLSDPATVKNVVFKTESETEFLSAGCLADGAYYAVMHDENQNTGETTYSLHTLNMTSGKDVKVADLKQEYSDLAYDPVGFALFAIAPYYDETTDEEGTALYQIETSNGTASEVARFKDRKFIGLTVKDGTIYLAELANAIKENGSKDFFNYNVTLATYSIPTATLGESVTYEGTTKSKGSYNSLSENAGKFYLTLGNKLYTLDPATKKLDSNYKSMPKELTGLCYALSSVDGTPAGGGETPDPTPTPESNVRTTAVETYDAATSKLTGKHVIWYNGANAAIREADYAVDAEGTATLTRYYYNEYDAAGQLALSYSQAYGKDGFAAATDSVTYTYDAAGNLTEKTDQAKGEKVQYMFGEDGKFQGELTFKLDTPDEPYLMKEVYDYDPATGKPSTIFITNALTGENATEMYAYTADGKKQSRTLSVMIAGDDELAMPTQVTTEHEEWTYDEKGNLTSDMLYKAPYDETTGKYTGEAVPYSNKTYTFDGTDSTRVIEKTAIAAELNEETGDITWKDEPTYTVTASTELQSALAGSLTAAPAEDKDDAVKGTFYIPEAAMIGGYTFDLYRNGEKVRTLDFMSDPMALGQDPETGAYTLSFTDKGLAAGTYDYFIQTVFTDPVLETATNYNVTNAVSVTVKGGESTGINQTATTAPASYADNTLKLAAPADVTIYAANGVPVLSASAATEVSLATLPQGVYVAVAKTAGTTQTLKVVKK